MLFSFCFIFPYFDFSVVCFVCTIFSIFLIVFLFLSQANWNISKEDNYDTVNNIATMDEVLSVDVDDTDDIEKVIGYIISIFMDVSLSVIISMTYPLSLSLFFLQGPVRLEDLKGTPKGGGGRRKSGGGGGGGGEDKKKGEHTPLQLEIIRAIAGIYLYSLLFLFLLF